MKYTIFKTNKNLVYDRDNFIRNLNGEFISGKDTPYYLYDWVTATTHYGAGYYLDMVRVPTDKGFRYYVENSDGTIKYLIRDYGTKDNVNYEVEDVDGDMVYYEDEEVRDTRDCWIMNCWRIIEYKKPETKIRRKYFFIGYKKIEYRNGEVKNINEYDEEY